MEVWKLCELNSSVANKVFGESLRKENGTKEAEYHILLPITSPIT